MNSDLQYCMVKLSQSNPSTLRKMRNFLDGQERSQDALISKKVAAKMLGVSRSTLWRMLKSEKLQIINVFNGMERLRLSDIQGIIASRSCEKSGGNAND